MYHQLKIRDKFIEYIKNGTKTHEYRLGTEERKNYKIGDILVLISNEDKDKYIKAIIEEINIFKSWDEALEANWENDFAGLFASIDLVKRECFRFYSKEEVDKYGIIVFKISPLKMNIKNSNVLLGYKHCYS